MLYRMLDVPGIRKVSNELLEARRRANQEQPLTKWINIIDTTNGFPKQKRILVRNNVRDVDHLMVTMTNRLQPTQGAIRNIFTPAGGTQVTSLDQLESHNCKNKDNCY